MGNLLLFQGLLFSGLGFSPLLCMLPSTPFCGTQYLRGAVPSPSTVSSWTSHQPIPFRRARGQFSLTAFLPSVSSQIRARVWQIAAAFKPWRWIKLKTCLGPSRLFSSGMSHTSSSRPHLSHEFWLSTGLWTQHVSCLCKSLGFWVLSPNLSQGLCSWALGLLLSKLKGIRENVQDWTNSPSFLSITFGGGAGQEMHYTALQSSFCPRPLPFL